MTRRARTATTGFLRDFQEFIMRGNVVDLAVAVIIGGAFSKIVDAFVTWLMSVILNPVLKQAGVDQLKNLPYGLGDLAVAIVNFLVVAFVIYLIIRALEKFLRRQEAEEAVSPPDPILESQERLTAAIDRLTSTMERR
ncbi:large conductance mechanosensitive channel protein MscL [Leptodesmis sichuanensis]|uniref:large conductance mechanosensitive channel protein MscL n=1 Tax=Leptodesmis sichuanensis TaxID=2906798 RepID=UPI0023594E8B|nr:large conductance mechanosensitive channel protein MscL [Leptodesmis sichuanensis]UIE36426.1 large conductance mechanosensitive channel protein MscL [Leptodesmis sichuanensis A121]